MPGYDAVIVGAGAAGCVLANRLSADPGRRVLLLEAGGQNPPLGSRMPAAWISLINSEVDWGYHTVPQARCFWRRLVWQGDACAQALRCLRHCTVPTSPINVSGPETLAVRALAAELGRRLGREPQVTGAEAERSWLTNTSLATRLFGEPQVPLSVMLDWTAAWTAAGRPSLNKPTKFEVRSGAY